MYKATGVLLIRILLGGLFFYQGFEILFISGIGLAHADIFVSNSSILLPDKLIRFSILIISITQLSGGILLIVGFLRNYSLYILSILILFITFSFGDVNVIWQFENTVFKAVLLISLLMLPIEWDKWSVDNLPDYKIN
jgi:putative oxidoreductase